MLALAGCAGGSRATEQSTAQETAGAGGAVSSATPFGVMSQTAPPAAPPSASPVASGAAAAPSTAAGSPEPPAASVPRASPAVSAPVVAAAPAGTAAPRILSVHTSPAVVHDGDTLLWDVRTTPDVVDVVAHVTVYAFRLQKHAAGQYVLTFTIPHGVPGFFHGNYTLDLVARSITGVQATTKVPVSFQ